MSHKVELVVEEKTSGVKKIREMIRDYAEFHADVIVLGAFGAKFETNNAARAHCIGTTAALVTQGCKAETIVVSQSSPELPLNGQRRFFVAVDGSDLAHHAYEKACKTQPKPDSTP